MSHTVYDRTSILKLAETKWNLPAMTHRDADAHSLLDMLDLSRVTGPGTIPPPNSVDPRAGKVAGTP